jgi:LmbE family N-acetylglucosaminyl deacetylase
LVVAAHPDDVDFGSAGTIATWADDGLEVSYCIVTDGDAGGIDPDVPRSAVGGIRRDEQRKAAATLGVTDVEFLGYPDGRLTVSIELRRDLTRIIRRKRPDRVVIPSPHRDLRNVYVSHPDHLAAGEAALCAVYPDGRLTVSLELRRDLTRVIRQRRPDRMMIPSPHRDLRNVYVSHPDHQAAGEAALCAVYPDARNPFAHPELLTEEGLEAHTVPEVWVVSSRDSADYRANCYVDITDTFDRKIAALRAHTSQTAHMTGLEERIRAWGSRQAQAAGLPAGRLAEGYLVLDTR